MIKRTALFARAELQRERAQVPQAGDAVRERATALGAEVVPA